ncbi:hypothetical protein AX15_007278 [Amanita polypyramis BW_CC]|nr:hypothetical protein AX15_007278 [Amanita polypyramis BW_CC]
MRVTISVLPVSLSLVHIPRSCLPQLFHSVIKQILQPDPVFLSITSNEIELSIFAESHTLQEFVLIARRDRYKRHSRSGPGYPRQKRCRDSEPIEISYENWRVLQIDSHSDQLDTSGARVNELSALLAAAGISILYQSSYMSDFIFVKECCLQRALDLFSNAGFDLYPVDATLTASGQADPHAPAGLTVDVGPVHSGAILTSSRSKPARTNALGMTFTPDESADEDVVSNAANSGRSSPHLGSNSPIPSEVVVLSPDLACVGLSDEFGVDHWGLKIVKLVAFPDLISPIKTKSPATPHYPTQSPVDIPILSDTSLPYGAISPDLSLSSSISEEDDGYFSHSPQGSSPKYSLPRIASRSQSDLAKPLLSTPSKHQKLTHSSLSPLQMPVVNSATNDNYVPFFSFTRTAEGSSLTTDVQLLATLFPPHERHMVICGAELAIADDTSEEDYSDTQGSTLKCLQVDLRQFGLDKHGLVNRFSRLLASNGINHMYSSTFKTANLLVEKNHANRAQQLLSTF